MPSRDIATLTVAEMLILLGDDPTRIHFEAAITKLCGVCPIPASSGKTHRFRLNKGGNKQANAALCRAAIVKMRSHEPTLAYVKNRRKRGYRKSEIIRRERIDFGRSSGPAKSCPAAYDFKLNAVLVSRLVNRHPALNSKNFALKECHLAEMMVRK
jgi:transposase IS116/IS110/IS902 family protein